MAASKPLALLASCVSAGCLSTESVGSKGKTRLLRQGRGEASPALKFHSVCFFCSIDWKDYDDREPRHKGQSEVLEGCCSRSEPFISIIVAGVRIKICTGPSTEVSVAPVILAVSELGHTFSFIRQREILIFVHLESLYSTILL